MSAIRTMGRANRVQTLTIDTTRLVSTFFLSNVYGLPETPAIYRSSRSRSNVVFWAVFRRVGQGQGAQKTWPQTTRGARHGGIAPAGSYSPDGPRGKGRTREEQGGGWGGFF